MEKGNADRQRDGGVFKTLLLFLRRSSPGGGWLFVMSPFGGRRFHFHKPQACLPSGRRAK